MYVCVCVVEGWKGIEDGDEQFGGLGDFCVYGGGEDDGDVEDEGGEVGE